MSTRALRAFATLPLCFALVGCGDRVGKLIAQLESSPDAATRRTAARALGEQTPTDRSRRNGVAKAVGDTEYERATSCHHDTGSNGPGGQIEPAHAQAGARRSTTNRSAVKAALAIGHIDPDDTSFRSVLIAAMREGDGQTMLAVGGMGQNAAWAVPTLVGLLSHREAKVRALAAHMLGRIGPTASEAKGTLQQLLRDSNAAVRDAAQHALDDIAKKPAADDG